MAVLEPKLAMLDETDSGLDIDALKVVADGVNAMRSPERAIIVVTHYQRLLNYIVPDFVHVLSDGRIVKSGGKELALELEAEGLRLDRDRRQPVGAMSAMTQVAEQASAAGCAARRASGRAAARAGCRICATRGVALRRARASRRCATRSGASRASRRSRDRVQLAPAVEARTRRRSTTFALRGRAVPARRA